MDLLSKGENVEVNALITVIVPVYNVEKYLSYCYATIAQQTYSNLEIILVDDGSTDRSGQICDEIANRDKRVRVIHKENEGLGLARNSGLKVASGKYVLFVDSDDYIEIDMVQKLYERIVQYDVDTSFCGYSVFFEEGRKQEKESYYKDNIFEKNEIVDNVLLEMIAGLPDAPVDAIIPMSVWHALYSLDIIKKYDLSFPSERQFISEDIIFHIAYLQHANRVSYIGNALYNYRLANQTSLTYKFKENEFEKQKIQFQKLNKDLSSFLPASKYDLRTKRYFLGRVRTCIDKAFTYKKHNAGFNLTRYIKSVFDDKLVCYVIRNYPFGENPIKIRLFNICVRYKLYAGALVLMTIRKMKRGARF